MAYWTLGFGESKQELSWKVKNGGFCKGAQVWLEWPPFPIWFGSALGVP
jgi:hypothetical protein